MVRAGKTFTVPDYKGLLLGKRMVLAMSAGQDFAVGAPYANYDYVVPYLRAIFGFIGVTDLTPITVATNSGAEVLAQTEIRAREQIDRLVASAA